MDRRNIEELEAQLRRRRAALLEGVAGNQQATSAIIGERESEAEENAQKERLARVSSRLSDRDQYAIKQIDAALERIEAGTYGECALCETDINVDRLRALPTAILCIDCATVREKRLRSAVAHKASRDFIGGESGIDGDMDMEELQ